jgi:hypothetical protein
MSNTTIDHLKSLSRNGLLCAVAVNSDGKLAAFCALLTPVHAGKQADVNHFCALGAIVRKNGQFKS